MHPRNPSPAPEARPGEARALVGVIAAGLLVGGAATMTLRTAGEWLHPGAAEAAKSAAGSAASAPAPAAPAAARPAASAAGKTAGGTAVVQSVAHVDEHVTYHYNALGRRDPFQSLIGGEYVGADVGGNAPPDVGGVKVVGIVWGDADQFALVEDARGDSHILRRGDKVMNGYVESLSRDAMFVNLTLDGQSHTVRIPLTRKGEKSNANR